MFAARSPMFDHQDRVYRLNADDGSPANFTIGVNYLVINTDREKPYPENGRPTEEQSRIWEPIRGLACDDNYLYVSNFLQNRVEIYRINNGDISIEDGEKVGQFDVAAPLGLSLDAGGRLWVANSGQYISAFSKTGDNVFTEDIAQRITGLNDPFGITIGGPDSHLYITVFGDSKVLEYDITGVPSPAGQVSFGGPALPGPVSNDRFLWQYSAGIAVNSLGDIAVTDLGNRRVQIFNSSGSLIDSIYSEFQPSPFVDKFPDQNTHNLLSGNWEYEIDLSGTVHSDWLGDGSWRLKNNWQPSDNKFYSNQSVRRTLQIDANTERDFIYYLGGRISGITIYAHESDGLRRSVMLGYDWRGIDELEEPSGGRWHWVDHNGNGDIDWNPDDPNPDNGEITWAVPMNQRSDILSSAPGYWVDNDGTIWIARYGKNIAKIPLQGFDSQQNPIYPWSNMQIVVEHNSSAFWNKLGTFQFNADTSGYIEIANTGADNYVQADAVLFLKDDGTEIIMDSEDITGITITGTWGTSTTVQNYKGTSYHHDHNTGQNSEVDSKRIRFTPALPSSGTYTVFVWQAPHPARASNVPITIHHVNGDSSIIINQQQDKTRGFLQNNVKTAPGGEIFALGYNNFQSDDLFWMGGSTVYKYSEDGTMLTNYTFPGGFASTSLVVDAEANAGYWYSGSNRGAKQRVRMWNRDGLLITDLRPGAANDFHSGWIDHFTGFYVFKHPGTGIRYVYAEDVWYGKSIRYRIDGLASIRCLSGEFANQGDDNGVPILLIDTEDNIGSHLSIKGDWGISSGTSGFNGEDYMYDSNSLKGEKSVRFTPSITCADHYRIYMSWTPHDNRASNVPVTIHHKNGEEIIYVDQRENGAQWNLLGTFEFERGMTGYVELTNAGTDGFVIADAIKVESEGCNLISPFANAGPDQQIKDGIVNLDGSGSSDTDGNITSWHWDFEYLFPDFPAIDLSADGEMPTVTELPKGVCNVTLTVTDNDGLADTDTMTVTSCFISTLIPK